MARRLVSSVHTLAVLFLLALASLSRAVHSHEQSSVHAVQSRATQTTVDASLSVGCPDFLDAFDAAPTSSLKPFLAYTLTKNTAYAYFSVHFAKLWLPRGASLRLRGVEDFTTPDNVLDISTYAFASGLRHTNRSSAALRAKELRVELYRTRDALDALDAVDSNATKDDACYGFVIDSYTFDAISQQPRVSTPSYESTCMQDNTQEAICYYDKYPLAYRASRAVARLLTKKSSGQSAACTGWLLGSDGLVITNNHCVATPQDAAMTSVEFMADASTCPRNCQKWGDCKGTTETKSCVVVYTNVELDFTLLQPVLAPDATPLTTKYGYLRLKATEGRVGQQIYIPQHPLYYGKRIAMVDDYGPRLTITDLNYEGCATAGYSYKGDTQGGSSGSPIIDSEDHGVVALHHCGQSCKNTGVPSARIIAALRASGVLPTNAIDEGDKRNVEFFPPFVPTEAPPPLPLHEELRVDGAIRLSVDSKTVSVDQYEFQLDEDADVEIDVLSVEISDNGAFEDVNRDCRAQYMDAVVRLFAKGSSVPLTSSDDSDPGAGAADGSISFRDPYLRTFLKKGTYMFALGAVPLSENDAFHGVSVKPTSPQMFNCQTIGSDYSAYRVTVRSSAAPKKLAFVRTPAPVALPTAVCAQPVVCTW